MKKRVTDEQALNIRDGFFQTLIVARDYDENGAMIPTIAGDVAADLLDARELLKEAEGVFQKIAVLNGLGHGGVECRLMLAKLKEYAE